MEILIVFNPQVTYPQLSTLSPQLSQRFPSSTINEQPVSNVIQATKTMDPSLFRIAIILTKEIQANTCQSILQSLSNVNCEYILYPQTIQPFNVPKNMIASSKLEIFNKIEQYQKKSHRTDNPKSIRMIAIKRSDNSDGSEKVWNSIGFNVLRSKDAEFNKQMNTIFFKYKANRNIKFNEIRDLEEIPSAPNQKQFLVVSHQDINLILAALPKLNARQQKVFKILFNTSTKMVNSNQVFDLNVNKTSIIRSQIDNYMNKMKMDTIPDDKSRTVNNQTSSMNISKNPTSMKSEDLYRLFILDNNNPKFKQMYQGLQAEGNVIFNLQNNEIANPKTILLAPYEIKDVLIQTINPQYGANIVLFDSSGGKDITQNNMESSKIAFVGKSLEQIKNFLKNKIKFNQPKIATGRTVKFIQQPPMISGTSIDKSLLLNKDNNSSLLYQHEWTVRRKAAVDKFITYFSNRQAEVMNGEESNIGGGQARSMRKMTTKKKTMVNLVEHEPSIKVIESENLLDGGQSTSVTKVVNEYYINNQRNSNINGQINQNVAQIGQNLFNQQRSNKQIAEYYENNIQVNKVEQINTAHGSIVNIPKPVISSKIIQDDYDETIISVKGSKLKSKILQPQSPSVLPFASFSPPLSTSPIQQFNVIVTTQSKADISPGFSHVESNSKQSSIDSFPNENSILNATSNFGYSPSIHSTTNQSKNLTMNNKNLSISIKPTQSKQIKEDKQVIQIMTTRGAPATISTSTDYPVQEYKSQSIQKTEEKVRGGSIDPSFVDHKYQRIVQNGITKYVIKKEYKDEMIKKILHERQPVNQIGGYNRDRVYSTEKSEVPRFEYNEYYGAQRTQESPRYMNVMTDRTRPVSKPPIPHFTTSASTKYKENYSPSPSSVHLSYSPRIPSISTIKNILYMIPNTRQTLIDRVKHLVTKNDTILPYTNQSELRSFSFGDYKIAFLFPKDENKEALLGKIADNCFVIKLNKQSKRFGVKDLFVNDIKELLRIAQEKQTKALKSSRSYTPSLSTFSTSSSIIILPSHLSHLKTSFNSKYQLYSTTQQLYQLLQTLKKDNKLVVVIDGTLMEFIDDFNVPSTTAFVVYEKGNANEGGLVAEVKALAMSY